MNTAERYVFDDRSDLYRFSGDLLAEIAQAEYGVEVDEQSRERWRQLMGIMRDFDTRADDFGLSRDESIAELAAFDTYEQVYPMLTAQELGTPVFDRLVDRTDTILRLSERAATTQSIDVYIQARVAESTQTVHMIDEVTLPPTTQQARYDEFITAAERLGEAATLWDSLIDGKKDVRRGDRMLKTSPRYYRDVSMAMFERARTNAMDVVHMRALGALACKGVLRVTNRLKHGVPSYSTLRMFDHTFIAQRLRGRDLQR